MKSSSIFMISFFIISLVLSIILINYSSYHYTKDLTEQSYENLKGIVISRTNHVETFLEEQKDKISIASGSALFEDTLKLNQNKLSLVEQEKFDRDLEEIIKHNREFFEIFILNKNGVITASSNREEIGDDKSKELYFIYGKEESYITSIHYSFSNKKNIFIVSAPITKHETNELLGVIVARVESEVLDEIVLDTTGLGELGEIYIINKEGFLITPSRFLKGKNKGILTQKVDTESSKNCFKMKEKGVHDIHEPINIFLNYRGEEVLGAHEHIPEVDWCLLAEIDKSENTKTPKNKFILNNSFVSIFLIFVSSLIGYFIGKHFDKKIKPRRRK